MNPCVATILALIQAPSATTGARFGIVYHLSTRSADAIPGRYIDGKFEADTGPPRLSMHRPLSGVATTGRLVRVVIDSENPDPEFAESQYRVRLFPLVADTNASVLFWEGGISAVVLPSDSVPLNPDVMTLVAHRARELVQLALKEADEDMVAPHDSVELARPFALKVRGAPGIEVINYQVLFKHQGVVADERGSLTFIVDPQAHRIVFSNFGHPEWGPRAEHVFALFPKVFFKVSGDSHTYLLAVHYGAWESMGTWVVLDAKTGTPLTANIAPLPN